MKRFTLLTGLLCLMIILLEGSAWAHRTHKLRPSADIRNSGQIAAKIDFCGAAGANGAGGGGAGGVSFAIGRSSTTVSATGNTLTNGSGGSSPGSNGVSGASGTIRDF